MADCRDISKVGNEITEPQKPLDPYIVSWFRLVISLLKMPALPAKSASSRKVFFLVSVKEFDIFSEKFASTLYPLGKWNYYDI